MLQNLYEKTYKKSRFLRDFLMFFYVVLIVAFCCGLLCFYKLNPIISPMRAVKSPSPMSERTVNFSFIISHEKNIVCKRSAFCRAFSQSFRL